MELLPEQILKLITQAHAKNGIVLKPDFLNSDPVLEGKPSVRFFNLSRKDTATINKFPADVIFAVKVESVKVTDRRAKDNKQVVEVNVCLVKSEPEQTSIQYRVAEGPEVFEAKMSGSVPFEQKVVPHVTLDKVWTIEGSIVTGTLVCLQSGLPVDFKPDSVYSDATLDQFRVAGLNLGKGQTANTVVQQLVDRLSTAQPLPPYMERGWSDNTKLKINQNLAHLALQDPELQAL